MTDTPSPENLTNEPYGRDTPFWNEQIKRGEERMAKKAKVKAALDGLDDFIQDGCSARPEDKAHALSGLQTIRELLERAR